MRERPVVVGAGAAGLAVAAALARRGVACDVLERASSVGSAWAGRYESLHLHTARALSGLPGMPIPRRYGRWVARDDVVEYLSHYAARFKITPDFGVEVTHVERAGDGWAVQTSAGRRRAPAVVFATSFSSQPFLPDWATSAISPFHLEHSSRYRNPQAYEGMRVLVVGAGNSGSEIAVDLVRAGVEVVMSVRRPPNILRRDLLGVPSQVFGIALRRVPERVMNPLGAALRRLSIPDLRAYGLPTPSGQTYTQFLSSGTVPILDHGFVQEVRAGRIRIVAAVRELSEAGVQLVDGTVCAVDAVICATGYRPGLQPIVGHLSVLDRRGIPLVHGAATVATAPGLYFSGVSIQLAGLLRELGIEARVISGAVARTLSAA